MSPAVELHGVTFDYGGPPVLRDVSLSVQRGEFFGLIGPNGGGKSTLLRLLLGQLQPAAGEVRVLGATPAQARGRIGYCPQHVAFPRRFPITVEETVMLGLLGPRPAFGGFTRAERARARTALESAEAAGLARRALADLSGGELQRVLIARALVSEPELLVLDESTANIDHHAGIEIFELLRHLSPRLTIIVVSHDIGFVSEYVGRVGCLNQSLECHPVGALDAGVLARLYESHAAFVDHAHH